jgi:hypothetical protein
VRSYLNLFSLHWLIDLFYVSPGHASSKSFLLESEVGLQSDCSMKNVNVLGFLRGISLDANGREAVDEAKDALPTSIASTRHSLF